MWSPFLERASVVTGVRALGLATLVLFLATPVSAQVPISRSTTTPLTFGSFGGTGFAPTPTATQLASNIWVPVGNAPPDPAITFGGTCAGAAVTTVCARGSAGLVALLPGIYAVAPPVLTGTALGLQSGTTLMPALRPGGVRLRMRNADTIPLLAIELRVQWASRHISLRPVADALSVHAVRCDGTLRGPALPIFSMGVGVGGGVWDSHDDTYEYRGVSIAPGANVCFELLVGEESGDRDLVAIGLVEIIVPSGTCGNGVLESGEECDSGTIGDEPCACDPLTCTIPGPTTLCDDGDDNPCTGACSMGECHGFEVRDDEFVEACEDGDPCTFDGCRGGVCVQISGCDGVDACTTCDPVARACGRTPGCCVDPSECLADGPCVTGICNDATHVCELVPTPDCDAGTLDAGLRDAASTPDGSVQRPDAGDGPDAASSAMDSGSDGGVHTGFGGGGGCRCAAVGAGSIHGTWLVVIALGAALFRRRRGARR